MDISGRRIRQLDKYLSYIKKGETIIIGLSDIYRFSDLLLKMGFAPEIQDGETILPPASLGPVSHYNSEGKNRIHKDQPMETAFRTIEWHWEEWHGPYDRVEQTRFVDVPYQRYPRTFISPPSIEFSISSSPEGSRVISTNPVRYTEENKKLILHTINLFLEIFQECTVFSNNLENIIPVRVIKVNWEILPPGQRPWNQIKEEIEPIIKEAPEGNQPVIRNRLESVAEYGPEFVAVGRGGFRGYLVFGFPQRNLFILESTRYGNATYVFDESWEKLSQLTKAEILNESLQKDRLIHREGWHHRLQEVMVT
jgi:hypothetical protein